MAEVVNEFNPNENASRTNPFRRIPSPSLQERAGEEMPAEQLMQEIWLYQRLQRDELCAVDGRRLRILHPGFWNREAGPDFQKAVIQIEGTGVLSGDVELDLLPGGWVSHGHHENDSFQRVILHVVWKAGRNSPPVHLLPCLELREHLDSPLTELQAWSGSSADRRVLPEFQGRCAAPLMEMTPEKRLAVLREAAGVRLRYRADRHLARARQAGWEQALWEALFRCLGYKHNPWPFQLIAESRNRLLDAPVPTSEADVLPMQSMLFGFAGLLPLEVSRQPQSHRYVRDLWAHWWRKREALEDLLLPKSIWHLHGHRPANHPERRLALAAHWLCRRRIVAGLEQWFASDLPKTQWARELVDLLQVDNDPFWNWHWTLRSNRLARPKPLLGLSRVTDLAMNAILPWFWTRAVAGRNDAFRQRAEERFFQWPSGQDNAVLQLARERLLASERSTNFSTAALQQGLLQIVHDFCEQSNAVCENCLFPEMVRRLL